MPYSKKFDSTLYNKTWLKRQYADKNANQVAILLGCDRGAVLRQLRRFGLKVKDASAAQKLAPHPGSHAPRPRQQFSRTLSNTEWLHQKYVVEGLTASAMAVEAECAVPSILKALRRHGFVTRTISQSKIGIRRKRKHDTQMSTQGLRMRLWREVPAGPCMVCEKPGRDVNHKDRNPRNPNPENLERLCVGCHRRQHATEERVMIDWLRRRFKVPYIEIHKAGRKRILAGIT